MGRGPTATWYFALVVVRLGPRFLLMQEAKYRNTWSLPGGRVEPGENLVGAAVREVLEETGVPVTINGIYRIEHTPTPTSARIRIIFAGEPTDDTPPKNIPDEESLGAAWLSLDEIAALDLRGSDLQSFLNEIARGRSVLPLDALGTELSI